MFYFMHVAHNVIIHERIFAINGTQSSKIHFICSKILPSLNSMLLSLEIVQALFFIFKLSVFFCFRMAIAMIKELLIISQNYKDVF